MRNKYQKSNNKHQAGVTLLISILILSGLALISSAIAVFTIQEIRASRATTATEPAIVGAEGASERGIYALKRISTSYCNPTDPTYASTAATLSNGVFSQYAITRQEINVKVEAGKDLTFYLYDPCHANDNIDLHGCGGTCPAYEYTRIYLECTEGNVFGSFSVARLDGSTAGITPASGPICPPTSTSPDQTIIVDPNLIPQGSEGRMKVTISSPGDVNLTLNTDKGMPNAPTIDAVACSSRGSTSDCTTNPELYSRRVSVSVPSGGFGTAYTPPSPPDTVTLIVNKSGSGSGTVTSGDSPQTINCGSICNNGYPNQSPYTTLTLTAAATSGVFTSWTGCDSTTGNQCTVTMNSDKQVVAVFTAGPTIVTTAASSVTSSSATLNGTVNPNGSSTTTWFRSRATDPGGSCTDSDAWGTHLPFPSGTLGPYTGSTVQAFSYNIPSGLTASTQYWFCAFGTNASGSSSGTPLSFTTTITPTLTWSGATSGCANTTGVGCATNLTSNPTLAFSAQPGTRTLTVNTNMTFIFRGAAGGGGGGWSPANANFDDGAGAGGGGGVINTTGMSITLLSTRTYTLWVGRGGGGGSDGEQTKLTNDLGTTIFQLNGGIHGISFASGGGHFPGGLGGTVTTGAPGITGGQGGDQWGTAGGQLNGRNATNGAGGGAGGGAGCGNGGGNGGNGSATGGAGGATGTSGTTASGQGGSSPGGSAGGGGGGGGGATFSGVASQWGGGGGGAGGPCAGGGAAGGGGGNGVAAFTYQP